MNAPRALRTALAVALALGAHSVSAGSGGTDLRMKLRARGGRVPASTSVALSFTVKNRLRTTVEASFRFEYAGQYLQDGGEPFVFATETLTLGAREKRRIQVACPTPDNQTGGHVFVAAHHVESGEMAFARVRIARRAAASEEKWLAGRDAYAESCSACHGANGSGLRGESLAAWIRAATTPDAPGMAALDLDAETVRNMRAFVRNPHRVVDAASPPAPDLEAATARILAANCAVCHNDEGGRDGDGFSIGIETLADLREEPDLVRWMIETHEMPAPALMEDEGVPTSRHREILLRVIGAWLEERE